MLGRLPQFPPCRPQHPEIHCFNSSSIDRNASSPLRAASSPARNAVRRSCDSRSQARSMEFCSAGSRLLQSGPAHLLPRFGPVPSGRKERASRRTGTPWKLKATLGTLVGALPLNTELEIQPRRELEHAGAGGRVVRSDRFAGLAKLRTVRNINVCRGDIEIRMIEDVAASLQPGTTKRAPVKHRRP